jgi:mannose-6-phosphate isomerase-like protein (cupin superfamily)
MTKAEMLERVAVWTDIKPNPQMFVDTRLPEHERDLYSIIGPGVSEDPETEPAITDAQDFNLAYIGAEPGKGAALHSHPTVEVFIPITGSWAVYWNEGDEREEVVIGPLDCISVPPGVMRGFRNAGDEHAYMIGIVGGTDSGHVDWAQSVLDRASETGLKLDADGYIVEAAE